MKKIAIVEDERITGDELADILQKADYEAVQIKNFSDVSKQLIELCPDLVILDINLPGVSGFQICCDIKQKSSIPVLILTSRDQTRDELKALNLGADEYLTKPFRNDRLLARVSNVLKRYEGRKNLLEGYGFLLDLQTYTLYINSQSIILPKNQGILLKTFLLHRDQIVSKDELCMALWGTTEFIDENALQVNLTRLKKTMTNLNIEQKIVAVRSKGYRLERS